MHLILAVAILCSVFAQIVRADEVAMPTARAKTLAMYWHNPELFLVSEKGEVKKIGEANESPQFRATTQNIGKLIRSVPNDVLIGMERGFLAHQLIGQGRNPEQVYRIVGALPNAHGEQAARAEHETWLVFSAMLDIYATGEKVGALNRLTAVLSGRQP